MTYDDLLRQVQGKRFEIKLFTILLINGIPNTFQLTAFVLFFYLPERYRCALPDQVSKFIEMNSSASNATLNYFIPYEKDGERSKCLRYNRSSEDIESFLKNATHGGYSQDSIENEITIPCQHGHFFYNPLAIHSVSMEFDWCCEKLWMKPVVSIIFLIGLAAASPAGFLSDRFGRRPIFNLFTLLIFLIMFVQSFSTSTWMYGTTQFISGLAFLVNFITGFVLGAECTVPEKRNFLSISAFVSFSFGYGISTLIFYLVPDWRWYLRTCSLIGLLYIPNYWVVPESPRWLMSKGRIEEAKKVLEMIAKTNNKSEDIIKKTFENVEKVSESLMENSGTKTSNDELTNKNCIKEMIKSRSMMKRIFVTAFSWFAVALVYYGIILSVQALNGNIFVNNTVMGLIEMPGFLLAYLTIKYLSRPKSHAGFMIVSGIFCMGTALLSKIQPELAALSGYAGKSLNAGAFYVVYIHTAEMFPTLVRNSCMCMGSFAGRLGSISSPYLSYMVDLHGFYAPFITMSVITIASGLLSLLFLPETLNAELPETVAESLKLKTLFSTCCRRNKKQDGGKFQNGCSESLKQETEVCEA